MTILEKLKLSVILMVVLIIFFSCIWETVKQLGREK